MPTPRERLNELRALQSGVSASTETPRQRLERLRALDADTQPGLVDNPGAGESIARGLSQGATFGFADEIGAGIQTGVQKAFGVEDGQRSFGENLQQQRGLRDQSQEANPLLFGGSQLAGGIASGTAVGGAALKGAQTIGQGIVRGAGQGALQGGLAGAGFADENKVEEGLELAAQGAAFGAALPAIVGSTQAILRTAQTPTYTRALRTLKDAGVKTVTLGQATGSKAIKATETSLAELPFTGVAGRIKRTRMEYQRALLAKSGLKNSQGLINEESLGKAQRRLSTQYRRALSGKRMDISTPEFADDLNRIESDFLRLRDFEQKGKVTSIIEELRDDAQRGTGFSGAEYQQLRSKIGKLAWKTKNEDLADLYSEIRNALDDQFQRSAPTPELAQLNKEFANLGTLQDIWRGRGGSEVVEGFLPPSALAKQANVGRNSGDFKQLVRAGSIILPDRTPNSATATRNAILALTGLGGAGVGAAATGELTMEDAVKIALYSAPILLGVRGATRGNLARSVVLEGPKVAAAATGALTGAAVTDK